MLIKEVVVIPSYILAVCESPLNNTGITFLPVLTALKDSFFLIRLIYNFKKCYYDRNNIKVSQTYW